MIRKITLSLFALASVLGASAQDSYLGEIEQNSLTLKALREQMEAEKLANKTGIYLSNPEVEFAYLWGSPAKIGNRTNLSITQEFDFPTAYIHKSERAGQLNENAELRYKSERINILLQAKELMAQLTQVNALVKLYTTRMQDAEQLLASYTKSSESGATGVLELNKSELNHNTASTELAQIKVEQEALLLQLKQLNGGVEINFTQSTFAHVPLPHDFEEWYIEMESKSPVLQYVKGEIMANESGVKLEQAMSLPKLSAGFMSESVVGQDFQGVSVGVSIPLWENTNRVKRAKAELKVAQTIAEDAKLTFYNSLKSLFQNALLLQNNVASTTSSLASLNSDKLLKKALELGEISLLTYLQEIDYYYTAQEEALATQSELAQILAQLFATEL